MLAIKRPSKNNGSRGDHGIIMKTRQCISNGSKLKSSDDDDDDDDNDDARFFGQSECAFIIVIS